MRNIFQLFNAFEVHNWLKKYDFSHLIFNFALLCAISKVQENEQKPEVNYPNMICYFLYAEVVNW
jgi:hypothetical protein